MAVFFAPVPLKFIRLYFVHLLFPVNRKTALLGGFLRMNFLVFPAQRGRAGGKARTGTALRECACRPVRELLSRSRIPLVNNYLSQARSFRFKDLMKSLIGPRSVNESARGDEIRVHSTPPWPEDRVPKPPTSTSDIWKKPDCSFGPS